MALVTGWRSSYKESCTNGQRFVKRNEEQRYPIKFQQHSIFNQIYYYGITPFEFSIQKCLSSLLSIIVKKDTCSEFTCHFLIILHDRLSV